MIEVIRIWLNGKREYFPGLAIAMQFHKNNAILDVMRKADNARNKERLLTIMQEEFTRLSTLQQNAGVPIPKKVKSPVRPVASYQVPATDQPEVNPIHLQSPVYLAAKEEADKAYRQAMNLRAVLFNKANVEGWEDPNTPERVKDRCKLAIDVVIAYREASRLYDKADRILQSGSVPAPEEALEEDYQALPDALAYKQLSNARKALSKLKQKQKLNPTADRLALMEKHQANILKLEAQCRTLK